MAVTINALSLARVRLCLTRLHAGRHCSALPAHPNTCIQHDIVSPHEGLPISERYYKINRSCCDENLQGKGRGLGANLLIVSSSTWSGWLTHVHLCC